VEDARGRNGVVIAGDFNAWAEEWGSVTTNAKGRTLLEIFASLDVTLLNNGTQHTFSRAGTGSIVDLTFTSASLFNYADWKVSDIYTASDHAAILCSIRDRSFSRETSAPLSKAYQTDTLNSQAFSTAIQSLAITGNAESGASQLVAQLSQACDRSMAQRRPYGRHHAPTYWWNERIANARQACLQARRRYSRSRGRHDYEERQLAYRMARYVLKAEIRKSKRECFWSYAILLSTTRGAKPTKQS